MATSPAISGAAFVTHRPCSSVWAPRCRRVLVAVLAAGLRQSRTPRQRGTWPPDWWPGGCRAGGTAARGGRHRTAGRADPDWRRTGLLEREARCWSQRPGRRADRLPPLPPPPPPRRCRIDCPILKQRRLRLISCGDINGGRKECGLNNEQAMTR